jgi:hypothetical protein
MWMVDSSAMWMVIPGMWIKSERSDAGMTIMPDTFEINQGARVIFSIIVSFPFLSLFRLSVAFVKPVLRACSFYFVFVLVPVFLGKISRQDRLRATISDSVDPQHPPVLSFFGTHFTFPKSGPG